MRSEPRWFSTFAQGTSLRRKTLRVFLPLLLGLVLGFFAVGAGSAAAEAPIVPDKQSSSGAQTQATQAPEVSTLGPANPRLAVQVGSDGRFNMGAFPDASGGQTTTSFDLMFRWPSAPGTSFTTLRIDSADYVYGATGTVVSAPQDAGASTNLSSWLIGDVRVTQKLEIATNPQTGLVDAARISYQVENTGSISHSVGLRFMNDTEINYNDGAPFRVPGQGAITTENEYLGAQIPDSFSVFYSLSDNQHVASATLRGAGCTPPDRLVVAAWPSISQTAYDYSVTAGRQITSDSAYALYWNPTALAPGASRTYVTYYGLGEFDADLTPPLALGVTGPASLSVAGSGYSPNPFTVTATVLNNGTQTAVGVQLTLTLPAGLTLASGSAMQSLGDLAVNAERQVSWSVRAQPRSQAATLDYSVTASAANAASKTVSRGVLVPVLQRAEPVMLKAPYFDQHVRNFTLGTAESNCRVDKRAGTFIIGSSARSRVGRAETQGGLVAKFTPSFTGRAKVKAVVMIKERRSFESIMRIGLSIPKLGSIQTAIVSLESTVFVSKTSTPSDTSSLDKEERFRTYLVDPLGGGPGSIPLAGNYFIFNYPASEVYAAETTIDVRAGEPVYLHGGIHTEEIVTGLIGWTAISVARYEAQLLYISVIPE
jgi:uncharacterized repeat protein (TIGR01451 family)